MKYVLFTCASSPLVCCMYIKVSVNLKNLIKMPSITNRNHPNNTISQCDITNGQVYFTILNQNVIHYAQQWYEHCVLKTEKQQKLFANTYVLFQRVNNYILFQIKVKISECNKWIFFTLMNPISILVLSKFTSSFFTLTASHFQCMHVMNPALFLN